MLGTLLLIVAANLAALAGPWLVGVAIDRGIPPLLHGGHAGPLALSVAGFVAAVLSRRSPPGRSSSRWAGSARRS